MSINFYKLAVISNDSLPAEDNNTVDDSFLDRLYDHKGAIIGSATGAGLGAGVGTLIYGAKALKKIKKHTPLPAWLAADKELGSAAKELAASQRGYERAVIDAETVIPSLVGGGIGFGIGNIAGSFYDSYRKRNRSNEHNS